jgi:hypothetical protein
VHDLQPLSGAVGGALIAFALAVMLIATGRLSGLSGIVGGLVTGTDRRWRACYVAGMLAAGGAFAILHPSTFDVGARVPLPVVGLAGLLVGFGTRVSNGCTSGHGLCGISRLSKRSIVATMTFFAVGVVTATVVGAVLR